MSRSSFTWFLLVVRCTWMRHDPKGDQGAWLCSRCQVEAGQRRAAP